MQLIIFPQALRFVFLGNNILWVYICKKVKNYEKD